MDTFVYTVTMTVADAAALNTAHPEWEVERAYTYDAAKAKKYRETKAAKAAADKAELAALRAEKAAATAK